MVLVLCIGDLHIPHRACALPPKFKELLKPGKIHHILCTGNLCNKGTLEYLRSICGDVQLVAGDFDDQTQAPEQLVTKVAGFKIGLTHGHQAVPWGDVAALEALQRQMDVDILVTGHTHELLTRQYEQRLIVNPGSATGAYGIAGAASPPSFVLIDLDGRSATAYVYQLVEGEVKVDKREFTLPGAAP